MISYMFFIRRILKLEKNRLACIMIIVALHCMVEHHYLDVCFNIFLLLTFASFDYVDNVRANSRKIS